MKELATDSEIDIESMHLPGMKGKKVVITAGASGIGLAIAHLLHAQGAQIAICDVDADALRSASSSLGHTIAKDEPHAINAGFTLERFRNGRLIDEAAAAAVAH